MDTYECIQRLGGVSAVAKICGVKPPSVSGWIQRGRIPVARCIELEIASGKKISCEDMRPDIKWRALRR